MSLRVLIAGAVALAIGLSALIWWDARVRSAAAVPDLDAAARVSAGRVIYDAHCASCHGKQLEGQPNWRDRLASGRLPAPPHDDSGHTWHHRYDVLFAITKQGLVPPVAPPGYQTDMPGFGDRLSDDDIWNVLAYIRSRWSDRVRARHDAMQKQQPGQ